MKLYVSESPVFFYSHKIKIKSCSNCQLLGLDSPDCKKCEYIYQLQFSDNKRDLKDVLLRQKEGDFVTRRLLKWDFSRKTTYRKSRHKTIFDSDYNPVGIIYGNELYNFINPIKLKEPLGIRLESKGIV